jgi:ABC-type multidrug transport system fused ATPase/permease subunit
MTPLADRSSLSLIFQILERRDKLRLGVSIVLVLVGTVLEMASVGALIPIVQTIVSGDKRSEYNWLPEQFQEISYGAFVQLLMLLLVVLFLVKNVFLLLSNHYQFRTQLSIGNRIVQRLFENYLRQRYEFHLVNSSAVLVRNVQEFSAAVIGFGIGPSLIILTDATTGLGLVLMLFLLQPVGTLSILFLLGAAAFVVAKVSRRHTRRWGSERMHHKAKLMEALLDGFGGVKEIRLSGREHEVVTTHRKSLFESARVSYLFNFSLAVPRALLEVVAVGSVALLVITSTLRNQSLESTTIVIALFGIVAFRMLPSANRLIQAVQQFAYGRKGIEGAVEGLSLPVPPKGIRQPSRFERFRSIEISGLKYKYPTVEAHVIDIRRLEVRAGESVGIVGASGSGKSTLVDLLIGILTPSAGTISMNGQNIVENPRDWQDRIGYVPQHVYLMDTTIRRNVAFGLPEKSIDDQQVEESLRNANLWQFVQSLPNGWDTVVGERGVRLSGGQRQRLGIARALYGRPEVIVLDEATSALDAETEREIVESFRDIARDRTLIVVAHRTSTLAYCSRLIRLESGRIVQEGSFDEVVGSLSPTDRGQ